ncbi:MAG: OprD family outer membrane porin [Sulfurimonas sp.]|uniref:OprD family outer membrane porin n=1 Tax=Sulfurimonas sp. TaxID=2022749 RepID=UPI002631BA81|nr:OprD family outer membrane porin [Sulfurimonas sp.]MDD2652050.1 OprD family outer membrane porin [Sulfurimonas sp.]MDD3452041.1 OprD family outer membrane porin [Sulfurimonas sp.]
MKIINVGLSLVVALSLSVAAEDVKPKRTLKANMNEVYNVLPTTANTFEEVFTKGMVYGHLRTNAFRWDWDSPDNATNADNKAFGLGGSLIYKTAPFYGLSTTVGFYYSNSPFSSLREDNADVGLVKSGKDTFSRYDVKTDGDWDMAVLAQSYIQYDVAKTSLKFGRQLFESALTASNDTKMIPNAFEGLSIESKDLPKTTLKAAYFTAQKLRDHTTFHDVITYKDSSGDSWNNNDDSGAHKGLSYSNFKNAGEDTEHELVIGALTNTSVENLKLDFTYTAVPDVLSSAIAEINYKIDLGGGYALTPGFRYMEQFDNGGGDIGGASLSGNLGMDKTPSTLLGYKDRFTLDSSAWMARLVLTKGALKLLAGYSDVADEADIVAPWRAFPTGGYTRAMAQLNWIANTQSTMLEASYDFGKANILKGFKTLARYVVQDFDEAKQGAGALADNKVIHIDLVQQITPQLDARVRFGNVNADNRLDGSNKDSYSEYRFEINYLF